MVSLKGPETATCIDVPLGSGYCVMIRAKPTGSVYTGHWSDWSDLLTGETPADKGMLTLKYTSELCPISVNQVILTAIAMQITLTDTVLMLCIPVSILITTIILIGFFPKLLR